MNRECVRCGDEVAYLSSRNFCDGCEEELDGCSCERGPLGGQHGAGCQFYRPIVPTRKPKIAGRSLTD